MIKLYKSDDRVSLKEREYVDDVYTVVSKESTNMEDDLRGIYVDDSLDALEDELSAEGFEYYDEGICIAPADCLYRIWKNDKYKIFIYFGNDDNIVYNIYVKEKDTTLESVCSRKRKLREQDVEIEVKHEGILEVPEGKNVEDLPIKHFVDLAKKKGLSKITKALNNLQVWNKKKNPSLSKWAGDMIDKVNKRMEKEEKKESWYPRVTTGYKWRTIAIPKDDDIEAEIEEMLVDFKSGDDRIEWDIDYNGGIFGDDRVVSIYSDGDVFTELKYKVRDIWDNYTYDLDESVSASLMNIKNQLMNKLGSAFKAIGGPMNPKVTVYPESDPDTSFEITTDGKNVDITPKYDGVPDTVHKKKGIAFMRAVNVLYDFIMNTLGDGKKLATESRRRRMWEGSFDRYDPNVEADFIEPGNLYNDMPDLEDLWVANKGLYLHDFIRDAYDHGFNKREIKDFIDKKQGPYESVRKRNNTISSKRKLVNGLKKDTTYKI